jgi:ABC-type glycerol-3-phosphate transport system substrate-binding protein
MYLGGRSQGWVVDNKLTIDEKVLNFIDFAKKLRENKYEAGHDRFSDEWFSAINSNEGAMAWVCPLWQIPNIVGSLDIKAGVKWGVVRPTYSFYKGGNWYGIYSKSQKKEISWEFIKYFTVNKGVVRNWAYECNEIPNNMEAISEGSLEKNRLLGVDRFKLFDPIVKEIDGKTVAEYDNAINSEFDKSLRLYLDGKIGSKEEMINTFKKNVKSHFDGLVVQ